MKTRYWITVSLPCVLFLAVCILWLYTYERLSRLQESSRIFAIQAGMLQAQIDFESGVTREYRKTPAVDVMRRHSFDEELSVEIWLVPDHDGSDYDELFVHYIDAYHARLRKPVHRQENTNH